jgi:preprotein translocase subunit SecY
MIPSMIANFFNVGWLNDLIQNPIVHGILYFLLVFIFTFFYTAVTFDPKNISSNLQKMGGFVPGIRPGQITADYLKSILNKVW